MSASDFEITSTRPKDFLNYIIKLPCRNGYPELVIFTPFSYDSALPSLTNRKASQRGVDSFSVDFSSSEQSSSTVVEL